MPNATGLVAAVHERPRVCWKNGNMQATQYADYLSVSRSVSSITSAQPQCFYDDAKNDCMVTRHFGSMETIEDVSPL